MEDVIITLRHIRPFGISGFELLLVVGIGMFVARSVEQWIKYLLIVILLGVLVHWAFRVNTALNWALGLSDCPPDPDSLSGIFECESSSS